MAHYDCTCCGEPMGISHDNCNYCQSGKCPVSRLTPSEQHQLDKMSERELLQNFVLGVLAVRQFLTHEEISSISISVHRAMTSATVIDTNGHTFGKRAMIDAKAALTWALGDFHNHHPNEEQKRAMRREELKAELAALDAADAAERAK